MKLRKMLLSPLFERSRFYCEYCGRDLLADPRLFESLVLDHLVPRNCGGKRTVDNLRVSCAGCDRLKGGRPVASEDEVRELLASIRSGVERYRQNYLTAFRTV